MIKNYIVFRDFETAEKTPHGCQVSEIAAVMIEPRSLTIVEDSLFHTKVQPEWDDEKAIKDGYLPVNFVSLGVSGFTKDNLSDAPNIKVAWSEYTNYLAKYNMKGKSASNFNMPIVAGYNSSNFDDIIDMNLCTKYGPKPNARGDWKIYNPIIKYDLMILLHQLWNNISINERNSISFDAVREYIGMSTENAHRANVDVLQGAFLLTKILGLFRKLSDGEIDISRGTRLKYKKCFDEENAKIREMLK